MLAKWVYHHVRMIASLLRSWPMAQIGLMYKALVSGHSSKLQLLNGPETHNFTRSTYFQVVWKLITTISSFYKYMRHGSDCFFVKAIYPKEPPIESSHTSILFFFPAIDSRVYQPAHKGIKTPTNKTAEGTIRPAKYISKKSERSRNLTTSSAI